MVESDVFVVAFVGAASVASFSSLPCEGRGGLGRGVFEISSNRGHPLPASPCLRRGRGKSGSSRLQAIRRPPAYTPSASCPPSQSHSSAGCRHTQRTQSAPKPAPSPPPPAQPRCAQLR